MAYTFEHINRRKATHINADRRNLLEGPFRSYPANNYLSGDGKSMLWSGQNYYTPGNREWIKHHDVKALPEIRKVDMKDFQSEDKWRKWQSERDAVGSIHGPTCASSGFKVSSNLHDSPGVKLSGYAFNPYNMWRTGNNARTMYNSHEPWPTNEARRVPQWRGPRGYYGYYHEELDEHHNGGYRYPRDPKTLYNDEDLIKYEYQRTFPSVQAHWKERILQ
ncbi:unnamed protein product [Owenia fusiformis]|uniref:Uncharacterized protein n=1 Tax=Owenia fusiformis TaxID=6347 RepID=A0A8J1XR63_OWEFU|nr:unnamed protein product [Owenia fusiformis]